MASVTPLSRRAEFKFKPFWAVGEPKCTFQIQVTKLVTKKIDPRFFFWIKKPPLALIV